MKPLSIVCIILSLFLISFSGAAQVKDSSLRKLLLAKDTAFQPVKKKEVPKYHSPKKAASLSALLPGAGQVYNKKYWKLPILYGGLLALAYSIDFNEHQYNLYRVAYKCNIDNDPTNNRYINGYSNTDLFTLQKYYNRYRDLSVIGVGLLYILNIVDAAVDAHLFTFDVSDDLSFHLQPAFINTSYRNNYSTGLSLNIKF